MDKVRFLRDLSLSSSNSRSRRNLTLSIFPASSAAASEAFTSETHDECLGAGWQVRLQFTRLSKRPLE